MNATLLRDEVDANGFAIVRKLVDAATLRSLRAASAELGQETARRTAGLRDPVARHSAFAEAAASKPIVGLTRALLGNEAHLVRSILFDKTPGANWDVVWHQDVTIAVDQRLEIDGFGPWSTKQGVQHVQPPASVLEQMVTLRLHLDDCADGNGPLLVSPGSHRAGFRNVAHLDTAELERSAFRCDVEAGDCVIMKPLTLHASKKALSPKHRRVLHMEFAHQALPAGLNWARVS